MVSQVSDGFRSLIEFLRTTGEWPKSTTLGAFNHIAPLGSERFVQGRIAELLSHSVALIQTVKMDQVDWVSPKCFLDASQVHALRLLTNIVRNIGCGYRTLDELSSRCRSFCSDDYRAVAIDSLKRLSLADVSGLLSVIATAAWAQCEADVAARWSVWRCCRTGDVFTEKFKPTVKSTPPKFEKNSLS